MGAHGCSHVIVAKTKAEAIAKAEDYQRAEQHENGHGPYSGHLGTAGVGVTVIEETFPNEKAAVEWIFDRHHKWDAPWLAKIDGDGDAWVLAGFCAS